MSRRAHAIRVVSWNVEMGYRPALAARELGAIAELRDADVILLQEVDDAAAGLIADELDMYVESAAAAEHPRTGRPFGNAVLSRAALDSATEVPLPHTAPVSGQPRSALRATTTVRDVTLTAYSVHTEIPLLPLVRRRAQFRAVAADVDGLAADQPVVVGGDFNTVTPRGVRALDAELRSAGLARAAHDHLPTLVRMRRPMRLDHIFARGLAPTGSGVSHAATASDHFPIWTELSRPLGS